MNRVGSLFLLRFFVISGRRVDSSYPDLLSLLKVLRKRKSYQNRFTFIQTHTLSSETITIIDTKFGGKFESGKWDTHTCSVVLLSDLHKTLKKPNFGNRKANDTEKEMKGTDERESFNLVTRSGFRSRQHSAEITRFTVWKARRSGSWPHLQQLPHRNLCQSFQQRATTTFGDCEGSDIKNLAPPCLLQFQNLSKYSSSSSGYIRSLL